MKIITGASWVYFSPCRYLLIFTCNFCSISASFFAVSTGLAPPKIAEVLLVPSDCSLLSVLSVVLGCNFNRGRSFDGSRIINKLNVQKH